MKKILSIFAALFVLCAGAVSANEWTNDDSIIRTEVTYKDVNDSFWAADEISNATRYGWFAGYPDGTFKPENSITRAEAAEAVADFLKVRLTDTVVSSYPDVDPLSWYASSAEAVKDMLYPSYGDEFRGMTNITREEALYLLVNAYRYDSLTESVDEDILNAFSDNGNINPDMRKRIAVGVSYGLMAGFNDGTLQPKGVLTRAQFATILDRLYSIGPNRVPTSAVLERIEISTGAHMNIPLNSRSEIRAEAVYSDGTRIDFTNNLNIYSDSDAVEIIENRIYGMKPGTAEVRFNNVNLAGQAVTVSVE